MNYMFAIAVLIAFLNYDYYLICSVLYAHGL